MKALDREVEAEMRRDQGLRSTSALSDDLDQSGQEDRVRPALSEPKQQQQILRCSC